MFTKTIMRLGCLFLLVCSTGVLASPVAYTIALYDRNGSKLTDNYSIGYIGWTGPINCADGETQCEVGPGGSLDINISQKNNPSNNCQYTFDNTVTPATYKPTPYNGSLPCIVKMYQTKTRGVFSIIVDDPIYPPK